MLKRFFIMLLVSFIVVFISVEVKAAEQGETVVPMNMIIIKLVKDAPVQVPETCELFASFQNSDLDFLLKMEDVLFVRALFPLKDLAYGPNPEPSIYDPTPQPASPVFVLYFTKAKTNLVELNQAINVFRQSPLVEWAGYINGMK